MIARGKVKRNMEMQNKGHKKSRPWVKAANVFKWFDLFERYLLGSYAFFKVGFYEINTSW